MMERRQLSSALYQNLQQHYVALLGQRDTGMKAVVEELADANTRQAYLRFLPLTLPLDMENAEEFKQFVIDRLVTVTQSVLGDAALTQRQMETLERYASQTADARLRRILNVLGQGMQTQHVVVILRTLNRVAMGPLKSLLLLLREYHELIGFPGEAGYRLRFLVVGDEQLWQLCRRKESPAISPFNIAKVLFVSGLSPEDIRARTATTPEDVAQDIASYTSGVPLLVDCYERFNREGLDARKAELYFPYVQRPWSELLPETQEALVAVMDGAANFPSCIPDYESPSIPDVKGSWSDAFWGGFLRLSGDRLTWRSAIHEAFVRAMAQRSAVTRLEAASVEERILHFEHAFHAPGDRLTRRQEGISLARETGSNELADLLVALEGGATVDDLATRVQYLAIHAPSIWLRAYCQHVTGSAGAVTDDLETKVLAGILVGAKRSLRAFDVFMCHNSQDKGQALEIAEGLLQAGKLPWLDVWEAPPGTIWQKVLEGDIKECKATAVFVGPSGMGPWHNMEIYAVLDEFTRRQRPIVPVFLPGAEQTADVPLFLRNFTWVDARQTGVNVIQQIIDAIGR